MNLVEINNQTRSKVDLVLIKQVCKKFLALSKLKNKEVSLALVDDKEIRKLNKLYRGLSNITDVLAFDGEDNFLGEVIIDYAQIKRQARQIGSSTKQELTFVLVHGLLHLLGYEDKTKKARVEMDKLTRRFMSKLKNHRNDV